MSILDPRNATLSDAVIEIVPEAIAREHCVLPFEVDEKTLSLYCPDEPDFCSEHEEHLSFIFQRQIKWLPVERVFLNQAIEFHFCDAFAKIQNCGVRFKVRCPLRWRALSPTDETNRRFCDVCKRSVYLCSSPEEAIDLGQNGNCVALTLDQGTELLGEIET